MHAGWLKETQPPKSAIWWIIGVALILRLIVIPILGPDNENLYEYGQIAWNIVQGYGFSWDFEGRFPMQPTAYSPALYCYTLVPWFALFGLDLAGPRIMHAVLLAAVCWFLFKIGERIAGWKVGLIAAAIWAVYPEMIFLVVRMSPENAMFIAMTALLYLALELPDTKPGKVSFGSGVLLGVSCWINPSLQILGPIIPVYWWLSGQLRGKKSILLIALFCLGAALTVSPWTIRNYIRLGAFVPLRTAFAYNVWRGNHIGATGTVRTWEGTDIDEAVPADYRMYYEAHMVPDEVERDRFFAQEVKRFIAEHPGDYVRLTLSRLYYYWWRDLTHPLTAHAAYIVPWVVILILAAIGFIVILPAWRTWSLWWLQIGAFTVLFSLTIVLPRYRMPIYPAMFLLAAVGLERIVARFLTRAGKSSS